MKPYIVLYGYGGCRAVLFCFECLATDADDAERQIRIVLPQAEVVWTVDTGDVFEAASDCWKWNQHAVVAEPA